MAKKMKRTVEPGALIKLCGGTNTATAEAFGVTKQAVGKWLRSGRPVPQRHHIAIARRFPKQYGHLLNG